ncbi:hypothetical protein PsorP6_006022 [Peronosclerospora sorghi]|uniref:Uncharacterized protein n=1 Tax=Peronosclerospora sorghi TaxID=230839 RepID=A0ACC0W6W5_9STRA|nr:hypothetical protein PsorP6_006022 [Peronosclerospora sorghi]
MAAGVLHVANIRCVVLTTSCSWVVRLGNDVENMTDKLALGDADDLVDDYILVSATAGDDDGVDGLLIAMLESALVGWRITLDLAAKSSWTYGEPSSGPMNPPRSTMRVRLCNGVAPYRINTRKNPET